MKLLNSADEKTPQQQQHQQYETRNRIAPIEIERVHDGIFVVEMFFKKILFQHVSSFFAPLHIGH